MNLVDCIPNVHIVLDENIIQDDDAIGCSRISIDARVFSDQNRVSDVYEAKPWPYRMERMSTRKIYLMSVAASGKSTFARKFPNFEGYRIIDYAQIVPRGTKWTKLKRYLSSVSSLTEKIFKEDMLSKDAEDYFHNLSTYMAHQTEPVVVMGRRTPDNLDIDDAFNDVRIGLVLIPEKDHRRNCNTRRSKLRYRIPVFRNWTIDFSRVLAARENAIAYAERQGIPMFASFQEAIRSLSQK